MDAQNLNFSNITNLLGQKSFYHEGLYSNISLKEMLIGVNNSHIIPPFLTSNANTHRIIYDVVHGYMSFPDIMWKIIDTPQFQRLRNLRQLATCYLVFPGANHTRFEHCLGTGYLSRDLVQRCFKTLNTENTFIVQCVTIAGLCHDIGHGPFSHGFNNALRKLGIGQDWEHEEFSGDLIKYLIDENNIDIDKETISLVHALITGEKKVHTEYPWIYQIVANKTNSIDVDKFDYICRDIYHLGLHTMSVNYNRVFSDCRIIDNNLCFSEKNDITLSSLFQTRFSLHKKVYKHNKVLCINEMICDALALSNDYFHFDEAILSPEKFFDLDDNIIQVIRRFSKNEDSSISANSNFLKAERIINNIYSRDLYRFIGEITIPSDISYFPDINDILSNDNPKDEFYLTADDITIQRCSYDFGNKKKNPFDAIYFYNSRCPEKSFRKLQRHSILTPNVFMENCIKVICKDPKKEERARNLFKIYEKKLLKQWGEFIDKPCFPIPLTKSPIINKKEFLNIKRQNPLNENQLTPVKKK